MDLEVTVTSKKEYEEDIEETVNVRDDRKEDVNESSGFIATAAAAAVESEKREASGCRSILADKEVRHTYLHTGCIALCLMTSGWRMSMTGPSLPDLRLIIDEDLSRASWIISAIALGGLVGSLCAGISYDRFNRYAVFVALTFTLAIASAATPWCSTFGSMVAIHVLNGACAWGIDTIAAADVVLVWREKSGPFLQAVNFAYSLGAMIAPLTTEPFFSKRITHSTYGHNASHGPASTISTTIISMPNMSTSDLLSYSDSNASNMSRRSGDNVSSTDIYEMSHSMTYEETRIHYAFLIAGLISLLAGIMFVLQYCCLGGVHKQRSKTCSKGVSKMYHPLSKNWRIVYVIVLSTVLSLYCTSERLFYSYLMTFLIDKLQWEKTAGASATTVYWITFTVGRLLSVFIVKRLKIMCVFAVFLGLLFSGECVMLVAVKMDSSVSVWVSCGLYGVGMSALFASIVNWISIRVCPYTGTVSSIAFSIVIVGAMVYPLIIGNIMSTISYNWFIYLEMILTGAMAVLLTIAEITFRFLTKRKTISE